MTFEELNAHVEKLDDGELIDLCNDVYECMYITGVFKEDGAVRKFAERIGCTTTRYIGDKAIEVATKRFSKVVLLLFQDVPYKFLKNAKQIEED